MVSSNTAWHISSPLHWLLTWGREICSPFSNLWNVESKLYFSASPWQLCQSTLLKKKSFISFFMISASIKPLGTCYVMNVSIYRRKRMHKYTKLLKMSSNMKWVTVYVIKCLAPHIRSRSVFSRAFSASTWKRWCLASEFANQSSRSIERCCMCHSQCWSKWYFINEWMNT